MLKLWIVYVANAEAKRMTHAERRGHTRVLHHAASDTMLQQQCLTILNCSQLADTRPHKDRNCLPNMNSGLQE